LGLLTILLVLAGCCAAPSATMMVGTPNRPVAANLALGPSRQHAAIAPLYARSDWPATIYGYRIGEVTDYSTVIYDEEDRYDEYGALFRAAETVRSGVLLR
jgi:hypothetical protein